MGETVTLKLENFEGPIGLLYHLIEKNKIDIYDIPVAEITRQYMEIINDAKHRNMEVMSEFLIMAASLLEIKSKMLLPKPKNSDEEDEEEDPREELIQKLIEYKKFKEAAEDFKEREEKAGYTIYKKPDASLVMFKEDEKQEIDEILDGITFDDLLRAYEDVMSRKELKTDKVRSGFRSVEPDVFTIDEKIVYIKDMLNITPKVSFWQVFRENTTKTEIVVTFLAVLELIKTKFVDIAQDEIFGEMVITKNIGDDNNETV